MSQLSIRSIIVVGSSGSGKTTAVNAVRSDAYRQKVIIPKRYITRAPRGNDDLAENAYISYEEFEERKAAGTIDPYWQRDLGGINPESYGFDRVDDQDGRLRIYSANNAFLRDTNESTLRILETGLVVAVMADVQARLQRLVARSPDIAGPQLKVRVTDDARDILTQTGIHIIKTTATAPEETEAAFRALVDSLLTPQPPYA